jgi:hypothetical protein
MSLVRALRHQSRVVLVALCVLAISPAGRSEELADFHAAVQRATAQYRIAIATLKTRSREETSAAVLRFRESWQSIIDQFGKNPPAAFADDEQYAGMFSLIDARLVGALIVIDIGSREAASDALAPIEETLTRLSMRSAPAPR